MLLSTSPSPEHLILFTQLCLGLFVLRAITYAIYYRYFHPYKNYPGPFLASISSLWYFRAVRYGRGQDTQFGIHKKYGPFVRVSPNQIQIMDPAAIETIASVILHTHIGMSNLLSMVRRIGLQSPRFVRSQKERTIKFYDGFNPNISPRRGGFEERDERIHMIRRRIVAPLYTQASILEFEPCVDRLISIFYHKMQHFAITCETFDMSTWLRKYTFDVIGEIFYGRAGGFGFMRDNIDYNDWCHLMDVMPSPAAAIPYLPLGFQNLYFIYQLINPSTRAGARGFLDVIKQSHVAVKERLADVELNSRGKPNNSTYETRQDMLTKLLALVTPPNSPHDPKTQLTTLDVTTEIWTMIWAGSDTTAIALTSIFYHLHRHPRTLETLLAEIDTAFASNTLTYPVRFADAIKLPYLHAVVREAMRIHPSLGVGLPRLVPDTGATICGRWFPGGRNLGVVMNQCAVHFDRGVFGPDAEQFVPERWIRDGPERAALMERHILQFGYGPRICIGKHITMLEMYKLLPTVLRDFEFVGVVRHADGEEQLVPPEQGLKEWTVWRGWFHQQKGVDVKVRRRKGREIPEEGVVVELGDWGRSAPAY